MVDDKIDTTPEPQAPPSARRRESGKSGETGLPATGLYSEFLDGLVGYHIRRVQVSLFRDFLRNVGDGKVSPALFSLMSLVYENPGTTQSKLAAALAIDRPSVLAMVDRLQADDFLVRKRSEVDRRRQTLFLTPKGKERYERLCDEVSAHDAKAMQPLSTDECKQMISLLKRLQKAAF